MARIIIGLLIVTLGVSALFDISLFKIAFSLILIAIGIRIMTGWGEKKDWGGEKSVSGEDYINEVAIFSALDKKIKADNFKGGKIVMVFGGGEIDLREARTSEEEINMEMTAVFGGGKLIIPKEWKVRSEGTAVLGGYDNKASGGTGDTVLNIKGAAIFGGIEIVN